LRWNIATADRKIANSLKDLQKFFKFAKLIMKIPNELGTQKRNASRSLPVSCLKFFCDYMDDFNPGVGMLYVPGIDFRK
jgi:hypothetical protein